MNAADTFSPLMRDVATALFGKPDTTLSNGSVLRWGSRGSFKVDLEGGVWHDKEKNEGGGVIDLIKRERRCEKPGAIEWLVEQGFIDPPAARERTFYDYTDERGTILFRVERCGSGANQRFLQHGPDGQGGFACRSGCMNGVRRILYRLDKLAVAPPKTLVFFTEGEKDCDRLLSLGLVATTNPGGAAKFNGLDACISQHLSGRRVIVLQDNDEAGANHVAGGIQAIRPHARAVAGLKLQGLSPKGDVSDWLNAGGSVVELVRLAEAALSEPQPDEPKPAFMRGISASDLMAKHFEPVNFVVPGLLAEGATLFAGKPKIGKSWMAYDFALAIASGRPVFGSIPVTQGDVLYLALEDSERRLKSRLLKKGIRQAPDRLTLATEWPGLDEGCIAELEAWADAVKRPSLVIVDVLKMVRGVTRGTESLYDADYRALTGLATFARNRGIAVMIVHHVRKMEADDPLESISGTNGLTGAADCVMVLKRESGTGHCTLYVRGRDVEESEKAVRFKPDNGTWELLGDANEVGRTNERQLILDALRKHDKPLSVRDISDLVGKNYDAIRKTLVRMWDAGEVLKEGRGLYACPMCPDVRNTSEPDNRTDRTGGMSQEEDDGWIGESPAETAARTGRSGR
ncbi:AAA family ATPase [Altererythrobacter sp. Root672]|uniref:AAA family ATPase n=1 Tax=Altererythrobacter sp. Root672 TaxID=1736584 RepID=UPI0006FE29BD|nr:AAA family ATPase [Altererythrobacter sp. Root672]KRA84174.1 hypothetical protein ASD76_09335 [Altererythrobacter sp. Root672]